MIVRQWPGYIAQKNFAASIATNDWILSIDADERVTPALAGEIRRTPAREVQDPPTARQSGIAFRG